MQTTSGDLEAIFRGRYVDWLRAQALEIPVWARLNLVTHAPLDEISDRDTKCTHRDASEAQWNAAEMAVASDVLWMANERPEVLAELQATVLFPLELALSGDAEVPTWTPGRFSCEVQAAMHNHPSSRFRRTS